MSRVERKFVLENGFKSKCVIKDLRKIYYLKKKFHPRQICTIYFDSLYLDLLHDNLSGYSNRIKSRIRFYPFENTQIIYEQKIKNNEIGLKKRIFLK